MNRLYRTSPRKSRPGYTLTELLVTMGSASLLFGGMASSIYIASQALQQEGGVSVQRLEADEVLNDVLADVKLARHFSERTANAVTFAVPDRDGDGDPEIIRYAWSGTPGDPLTYEYNGGAPVNVAEDVHKFNLVAMTRTVTAPPLNTGPPPGGSNVLLVVSSAVSPTAQETARKTLMESWGYVVTLIDDGDSQVNYDAAVADSDVVYVPETVNPTALGTKLVGAVIGVVNEEGQLIDDFGFASGSPTPITLTDASITDNTHYITSPLALGDLAPSDPWQPFTYVNSGVAAGVQVIATVWNKSSLMVADAGAELLGGASAAGRRVQLPWGSDGFDFSALNLTSQTLMQRSIEWAAGAGEETPPALLFVSGGGVVVQWPSGEPLIMPTAQEQLRIDLIESWGYVVILIDDADTQANFDAAVADTVAAYVPQTVDHLALGTKLKNATIGVVNEDSYLYEEFGFAAGATYKTRDEVRVLDNSHYITSIFATTGYHKICTSVQPFCGLDGNFAPGMVTLADIYNTGADANNKPSLVAFPTGGELNDTTNAAGRRVSVPWGGSGFDVNSFNSDGLALMQRAIDWAAGAGDAGGPAPDGNFGYETQFASKFSPGNARQVGTQVTLSEDGTLTSITAYIDPGGGKGDYRYAIYTDNAGEPGNLIVESPVAAGGGTGWRTISVTPTPLTAGTYWLALSFSHGTQDYYYEATGGTTRHKLHDAVNNGFISVWPGSTTPYSHKVSIYGTYTPSN